MGMSGKAKAAGCTGCGCVVVFVVSLCTFLYIVIFTNSCAKMFGEETYPLKSPANRFDPFVGIEEVRERVGKNAHLVEVEASFVRHDGTMDLTATYRPAPRVTYKFVMPLDKAPDNAPPVGAGRSPGDVWIQQVDVDCYEPGQMRSVTKISGGSTTKYQYHNEGMDIDRRTASMGKLEPDIGAPKVTTSKLWEMAVANGAMKDAVARIKFDKDGYELSITGTPVRVELGPDGQPKG
jgi:hypothetical protein